MRIASLTAFASLALIGAGHAQGLLHAWSGELAQDWFGVGDGAGDVDGDGFADVVIGAPNDDDAGSSAGVVFVRSGRTGALLYKFAGDSPDDMLGENVAGGLDVNGDGVPDVAAGADRDDDNGHDAGSVRVFSGATGAALFTFHGDAADDRLGAAVAAAGDVDGDGFDDLVVGIPSDDDQGQNCGGVRVFSGRNGAILFTAYGDAAGDRLGYQVSGAGDVDADGFADVLATAVLDDDGGTDSGSVRVYVGPGGAAAHTFFGSNAFDYLGISASAMGDVNGDGHGDVAIGAFGDDAAGVDAGRVTIFSGLAFVPLSSFLGRHPSEKLGSTIDGGGDLDGDGIGDLLATLPGATLGGQVIGALAAYSGGTNAALFFIQGDHPAQSATRGRFAGDVNGDARADVVVGAVTDDVNGAYSGSARIYSGACGSVTAYGAACPGGSGVAPSLAVLGCLASGVTIAVEIENGAASSTPLLAFLAIGAQAANVPLAGGCTLLVGAIVGLAGPLPLDGAGRFAAAVPIPYGVPAGTATVQAFVIDAPAAAGFAATTGLAISFP